jgi:ATP-dependent DNA helicase RecG
VLKTKLLLSSHSQSALTLQKHPTTCSVLAGYQALLLAPTELLVTQHMSTLSFIADRLPLAMRPRVELLTSSISAKEKATVKAKLAKGDVDLLVSTSAALWLKGWSKLALVVVDEQHK